MNRSERYIIFGLIILCLFIHILLANHFGLRELFDARVYVKEADYLIQFGRLEDNDHLFHLTLISLIACFKKLFSGQILPYFFFQCAVSCVAMLSLYFSSVKIFNSKCAGLLTGLMFLLWWDNIHWNITTMTESLACSVTCFIIYSLTFFRNTSKDYWAISILLMISFFIRPTAIIVIVGTIAFMLQYHWKVLKTKQILKFTIISSIILIGFVGAIMMFSKWDFTDQLKRGNIVTYMDTIEGKPLYQESMRLNAKHIELGSESQHPLTRIVLYIFHNPLHFLKTASLKIWYLVSFYRPYYSTLHNVFALVWVGIIYSLCFLGFRNTNHSIKVFALAIIIVNCALIAVATVDWDNRFFIPMEPGIVLFAGGGGAYAIKRMFSLIRRYS